MELQNILIEALKDRYKANALVRAIEKKIEQIAEGSVFEKYKTKIHSKDGMEYKLGGVRASVYTCESDVRLPMVDLKLAYFCKSKLPKNKREKLEQVILDYNNKKYLKWCYYNIPAWKELHYRVSIEKVLSNDIDLRIE